MANGREKYEKIVSPALRSHGLSRTLSALSVATVVLTVGFFGISLILLLINREFITVLKLASVTGVPFVLVSILRKIMNFPRPYEVYPDLFKSLPKSKSGESFPSRHVFSIFVIGSAYIFINAYAGVALLALGVILAVCRVMLGIHFIKDVAVGALLGAVSGGGGMLIANLIVG